MNPEEILFMIEKLRMQLVHYTQNRDLFDPEVVRLSKILDAWLNLYHITQINLAKRPSY